MSPTRRAYFYAASLIGFLASLAGLSFAIRHALIGLAEGQSPTVALLGGTGLWWLLLAVVALVIWLGHWIPANLAARPLTMAGALERASFARKAYFFFGQFAALAAAVVQTGLALRAILLLLLGGAVEDGAPGVGEALALAAGSALALVAWGYLRWENGRDDDLGRETGVILYLRRFYVYLFAFLGLALAFGGAGELVRAVVSLLARPLDASTPWREPLAAAAAALIVGLPLSLLAWRTAHRAARVAPAAEVNALDRVILRYGGLALGAAVTLLSFGYLIEQLALLILRQPREALSQLPLLGALDWTYAIAYLPAAVITWASFADGIREDVALGGEAARTATVRRLICYVIAAVTLAAFWFGLTEFARLILQVVLGSPQGAPTFIADWWSRFARATALVLVAAPAWWGHWWSQQVRARMLGAAGHAERTSLIRRVYLWAIVLVGAVLTVAALGFAAFLALNWSVASASGSGRAAVAGAAAAAGVALFWTATHGLVLRGDLRWLAAESATPVVTEVKAEVEKVEVSPSPSAPAPTGPRRYRREDLAALAAGAGSATSPRPLAVIDGGDGAIGGALVAALRQARPDIPLWPIGLNAAAQVAMLNALGGDMAPAVPPDALGRVAAILGPADILAAGGLDGEVTADLAAAVAGSPARVLLLPPRDPHLRWVAAPEWPLSRWVENAVIEAVGASD